MTPPLSCSLREVQRARMLDLTCYKSSTLRRRIEHRTQLLGLPELGAYREHPRAKPGEFDELFSTVLINVMRFFPDIAVWDHLRTITLPQLIAEKPPREPIRLWSAGCATGEEAYTLAMVCAEAFGIDEVCQRVKIYATDVDEPALHEGRRGSARAWEASCRPRARLRARIAAGAGSDVA